MSTMILCVAAVVLVVVVLVRLVVLSQLVAEVMGTSAEVL